MNISEVAAEVSARLNTINGLRCFPYQPGSITPPAAMVLNPSPGDLQYDKTYGRGMDRMTLPLLLVAGRASERTAQDAIRAYLDGSGARSVKATLESGEYTSLDSLVVMTSGVDGVSIGGTEYLAALFDLDIAGQGRG